MKKFVIFFAAAVLLIGFSGCSHFFYPRADDFAEKAKGASTVETLLNLTTMMEASAQASKGGTGMDQPLGRSAQSAPCFQRYSVLCRGRQTQNTGL